MAANLSMVLDVVDERNRPVGRAARGDVLQKGLGFRTVHIFLLDGFGRMLLQRLPNDHARNPGKLGSSVAGYLYAGESYLEAAQRKLRRELGFWAPLFDAGVWQMADGASSKFVAVFSGRATEAPVFDRDEIAEIVYMDPEQVTHWVKNDPSRFTLTCVFAYEHFREGGADRWKNGS